MGVTEQCAVPKMSNKCCPGRQSHEQLAYKYCRRLSNSPCPMVPSTPESISSRLIFVRCSFSLPVDAKAAIN
jgi:hypothetical protein